MAIKLFHYRFKDSDKKLTIECHNRDEARLWLDNIMSQDEEYFKDHPVVDEKVETPVSGVTEKAQNGKEYVWYSNGRNEGWLLKSDYDEICSKR